jgi:YbbR domain-containing protein
MSQLGSHNVSAQVDLSDAGEGERIVHLTPATIHVPFGVRVVKVHPSLLNLRLERTVDRDVPVRPRVVGQPAPGYEVVDVASEPAAVRIVGPRTHVEKLAEAFTEPVDVGGLDATRVADNVSIGFDDPILHVEGPSMVRVTVRIGEAREARVFDDMRLEVRGGPAAVTPARVRVVVRGPASVVRALAPAAVKAYVDAAGLRGEGRLPVAVELAPGSTGVEVESTEPPTVAVKR